MQFASLRLKPSLKAARSPPHKARILSSSKPPLFCFILLSFALFKLDIPPCLLAGDHRARRINLTFSFRVVSVGALAKRANLRFQISSVHKFHILKF